MKLAGLDISVRKDKDKSWSGVISSGSYISKRFMCYSAESEAEAAREILEDWLQQAGLELAMTKQLWFVFTEEVSR